jgi:glycosyltransferase involved in cell wall biosynthesis
MDVHIAVLMMVKNEKKRLHVSLESIKDFANSLIIYDTGSTDETIQILRDFSETSGIPLRLKEGEFIDFSTSRNVSLDFADTFDDVDYLLLMDTNDELRRGDELRKFAIDMKDNISTGFFVAQEWWSGELNRYYNLRFVKVREGWRYRGSVHEWLKNTKYGEGEKEPPTVKIPIQEIVLYQDRTQDDDKSSKRYSRDKELLMNEHMSNPTDTRTIFYLAQTLSCLNDYENAFHYYKMRSTLEGFQEEKFHAFLRAGDMLVKLNRSWDEILPWYMKAFEQMPRVEPILKIADYYRSRNKWLLAYTFANMACVLNYPEHCILFIEKRDYDYKRWHILGIVAYYAGFFREGKIACEKAISTGVNILLDTNNLRFYEAKEREEKEKNEMKNLSVVNKKDFFACVIQNLSKEQPKLSESQMNSKALKLWKSRKGNNGNK